MTKRAAFVVMLTALVLVPSFVRSEDLPTAITDREFWRIVTEFSEPGGRFQLQYMSNEDSLQYVIPSLKEAIRPGGVYVGVGTEQNFTYVSALQPKLAFIVDIRRDNMLEHLMYKALFELSSDRADFIGRLFSRRRPPGSVALDASSTAEALFGAYQTMAPDAQLYEEQVRLVIDRLTRDHDFQLGESDQASIAAILNTFRLAGPYALKGTGDKNQTYSQLMAGTDLEGRSQSYLASEENFRTVKRLESQNLIVPLVGDFAGDKAIMSIGRYLKEHRAPVNVFYVSNVERYLFEQSEHGRQFYANVAMLPLEQSSLFIRSVTVDISRRLGIQVPDGAASWRSLLFPINDCLKAFSDGHLETYRDLFERGR
jgi:hypothetical protein